MKTVVKDLFRKQDEFGGKEITVSGWIRNIRISKNFGFIELNDGTFFKNLQIVIESDKLDNFAELSKLNIAAAITATGTLVLTPDAKQPFELKAENVVIDGESTPDYPLQKKRHSFEYLRTVAHLRPRTNTFSAVFRVRQWLRMQFTNSSRREDLYTFILRLSLQVTARARAKCSKLQHLI